MKIKIIASGSKGNSALITSANTKILLDIGIPFNKLKEKIDSNMISTLDGVLITHCHEDHIKGLKQLVKSTKVPIYVRNEKILSTNQFYCNIGKEFKIKDLDITFFPLSHDVECSGVMIKENKKELIYITDTGYINSNTLNKITNKDLYVIESNYDEEMLLNCNRPFQIKQRILGDKGHLSNKSCARYLSLLIGSNTKTIILAHISEDNNTSDLIYNELNKKIKFDGEIILSSQDTPLKEQEV